MQLAYTVLDVFTNKPMTGNQLAVVSKADGLSDDRMQAIAREFNLSETVFVRQPLVERHTASLRIFTPSTELPFAGHPTIGTAVLLGLQQRAAAVRLEEPIGLVTCIMERVTRNSGVARFKLPKLPEEKGPGPAIADVATTLGIAPDEIGCGAYTTPMHYSAGVDFYLVPVRNAEVLSRVKLERRGWNEVYPAGHNAVYVFTETPEERGNDFAARMFAPGMGIGEDPATGAAAAALIGLIAAVGPHETGQAGYRLRQGHEMGRPSLIELQVGLEDRKLVHGGIGGSAVIVAEGRLDLPD